jgi:hypothetical protein
MLLSSINVSIFCPRVLLSIITIALLLSALAVVKLFCCSDIIYRYVMI